MDRGHRLLGLGPLPGGPVFEYLARSISFLYAFLGGFAWVLSTDVRRYATPIRFYGTVFIIFGVVMLFTDLRVGMPAFWTYQEGPVVMCVGAITLALQRRVGPG